MSYRMKSAAMVGAIALLATVACTPSDSAEPSTGTASVGEPSAAPSEGAFAGAVQVSFDGTIPDGWVAGDDYPVPEDDTVVFEVLQDMRVLDADCLEADLTVGESADEFTAALAAREGLNASDPTAVTVDDLDGYQFDFTAIADSPGMTCGGESVPLSIDPDTGGFIGASAIEDTRVFVLDVPGGGNLVIRTYAVAPQVLADHLDAAMSVVDGLRFEVP